LVKVTEDRVFIFCIWNGRYVAFDRKDGRVVERGKGDDVLKRFNCLEPLKLTVTPPSIGRHLSDDKWKKLEREELEAGRQTSAINLIQVVQGSKLYKDYVVQFDKAGLGRRPLVVIAWKARLHLEGESVDLNHTDQDIPAITIDGHSVVPPRTKKAIYALQPDYSLRQLPLTEEEITRLFSHITRSQERATFDERNTLPSDPYWEQKVDPHLKVVEPSQKDTH
jgi:hypothetical protein